MGMQCNNFVILGLELVDYSTNTTAIRIRPSFYSSTIIFSFISHLPKECLSGTYR